MLRPQTARAELDPLLRSIDSNDGGVNVRLESPCRVTLGMANVAPEHRRLAAYIALQLGLPLTGILTLR